jgi:hypothetical protein
MNLKTNLKLSVCFEALKNIRTLSKPGQQLNVHQAVDLICDIWNISDSAIKQTRWSDAEAAEEKKNYVDYSVDTTPRPDQNKKIET